VVLFSVMTPTRNRSTFVRQTIDAVMRQDFQDFELVVSDNSTPRDQELEEALREKMDPRIVYVAPPHAMGMGEHWEFAANRLKGDYVLTIGDRWLLLPGALARLAAEIRQHRPDVMSFASSHLYSDDPPLALRRPRFSGRTCWFNSLDVARACSLSVFPAGLPTMVNSVVRHAALLEMQHAYGSVLAGAAAPDVSFGMHMLDSLPGFHYYDRPLVLNHGLSQSNGRLLDQGKIEGASRDFLAKLELQGSLSYAPIPNIHSNHNIRVHEYERMRSRQRSGRFVRVDSQQYYLAMLFELQERDHLDPIATSLLEEFRARNDLSSRRVVRGGLSGFIRTPMVRRLIEPVLDALHRVTTVNIGNRPAGRFRTLEALFAHEQGHPPEPNAGRAMLLTPLQRVWLQQAEPLLADRL
jgi:glycosyltransferase involved in cell wall biosynthesis